MKVSLKSITPNAEVNIVEIARVSSSRENKAEKPEKLVKYLIDNKHWSPFEHSYLTFEIETSKAIAIQLLRHRSATFQEFSQRYAKVEKFEDCEFRLQAEKNRQSSTDILFSVKRAENNTYFDECVNNNYKDLSGKVASFLMEADLLYSEMIDRGVAKECARFILPMCTSTTLYMTGPVRSWIHFLEARDDGHAQKEAQNVAKEIKKIFVKELPIISKALGWLG